MKKSKFYLGIDIGSVSLNLVIIDDSEKIRASIYERTKGRPLQVLLESLNELSDEFNFFEGIAVTGSGRKLAGKILDIPDINEIIAQARAACFFHPEVRTIIEIGGQDSKLIFIDQDPETGEPVIVDHVLNEVCAAATGSFLDLQAHRLGMTIDDFASAALSSKKPASISGRCSVFAKSDMVHLLQEGTPKPDVLAGLCHALARNFIANLGKGKIFKPPVMFQGGVAANQAVVKAFKNLPAKGFGSLVIPEHFLVMGSFGTAIMARENPSGSSAQKSLLTGKIKKALASAGFRPSEVHLKPLVPKSSHWDTQDQYFGITSKDSNELFLGIDVGAASTNIVLIDKHGKLVVKIYRQTRGEPVAAVKAGLEDIAGRIGENIKICGVGITGSGRYFIGDFVGADVVINEISAQARAAVHIDPEVDTIIEIGGQDSKYIKCKNGRVIDFEMNNVCAAGTGSFLEEQGSRLKVEIKKDFSRLAFSSNAPVNLGARCTVFMESDLIHHQQNGKNPGDLTAGLSYAIASNYLEKVVENKKIEGKIFFQGGVAANQSVVAAFESILEKTLIIPEHHNVTGALGAALASIDSPPSLQSRFAGFNLKERPYEVKKFECRKCPNLCSIHQIYIDGQLSSYYGSLCGRYEKVADSRDYSHLPDLFKEREEHLVKGFEMGILPEFEKPVMGIPRSFCFFDYFPFWESFFKTLGYHVILSERTNNSLIQEGLLKVQSETCFPIKTIYGHIGNLVSKGADQIFLPCEIDHHKNKDDIHRTYNCPYIQALPYMTGDAMGTDAKILAPVIRWSDSVKDFDETLMALGKSLGHVPGKIKQAVNKARNFQNSFDDWRRSRGKEVLEALGPEDRCLVLLGKSHNIFDPGLNLHLAGKLRREGELVIPFDMLPTDEITLPEHYENVVWKNTRDLLKVLFWLRNDKRFFPVLLTNFGCGPDSFFIKYMEDILQDRPYLILEIDEHTGDAGLVTRIEAFLDTLDTQIKTYEPQAPLNLVIKSKGPRLNIWRPEPNIVKKLKNRTLYGPYVSSAFSSIFKAAFESAGFDFSILPKPDEKTEYLGRQVTSGRECHPFIVTCGDFVKMTHEPGFDPEHAAFFMLNYDGACRFSQYSLGHAALFKHMGIPEVPVIAPLCSTRFEELTGLFGLGFTVQLWQGLMATEVLDRFRLHVRPYEKNFGETDRVYESGIEEISEATAHCRGIFSIVDYKIHSALKKAVRALEKVDVDMSVPRPIIGIVGEFYTVLNRWANQDFVRILEDLGIEVKIHGLTITNNLAFYSAYYYHKDRLKKGKIGAAFYYFLRKFWVDFCIKHAEESLDSSFSPFGILDRKTILSEAEPYIHFDIDAILSTFTARARGFALSGVSGLCNIYVLNCMLGNISIPVLKNALQEYKNFPLMNLVFDAQMGTNMLTRIEAFVHQVKLYHNRYNHLK
ncbi:MAG TPA: hypothetical protein DD405_04640 [Desulfobacteraceae bacterium]|nr:hypothetical protein [Desulfobacteraceae bacterium]